MYKKEKWNGERKGGLDGGGGGFCINIHEHTSTSRTHHKVTDGEID